MPSSETVLNIIRANPGASGFDIHTELVKRSRMARWFGEGSMLTAMFGPNVGALYVTLANLERSGAVTSHLGRATPERGWRRPRHYYAREATTR